jgi:hypothetical protein
MGAFIGWRYIGVIEPCDGVFKSAAIEEAIEIDGATREASDGRECSSVYGTGYRTSHRIRVLRYHEPMVFCECCATSDRHDGLRSRVDRQELRSAVPDGLFAVIRIRAEERRPDVQAECTSFRVRRPDVQVERIQVSEPPWAYGRPREPEVSLQRLDAARCPV